MEHRAGQDRPDGTLGRLTRRERGRICGKPDLQQHERARPASYRYSGGAIPMKVPLYRKEPLGRDLIDSNLGLVRLMERTGRLGSPPGATPEVRRDAELTKHATRTQARHAEPTKRAMRTQARHADPSAPCGTQARHADPSAPCGAKHAARSQAKAPDASTVLTKRHSRSSARNPVAARGWSRARRYRASDRVSGRGRRNGSAAGGRASSRRCSPRSSSARPRSARPGCHAGCTGRRTAVPAGGAPPGSAVTLRA